MKAKRITTQAVKTVERRVQNLRRVKLPPQMIDSIDPCHQCPRTARCTVELLACDAFAAFTNGSALKTWRKLAYVPTRAIFIKLFGEPP